MKVLLTHTFSVKITKYNFDKFELRDFISPMIRYNFSVLEKIVVVTALTALQVKNQYSPFAHKQIQLYVSLIIQL